MSQPDPSPPLTDDDVELASIVAADNGGSPSLLALVESLLFVADEPVSVGRLAEALEVAESEIEAALSRLEQDCAGRGLHLQRVRGMVQLTTTPEAAPYIERFLGLELRSRLSTAALETLAIVAYQQPVTRPEVEAVRGVNCDGVLRTLLGKGLIEEVGRMQTVGRPILYGTTFEFLQYFGLKSLGDLPDLDQLDDLPHLPDPADGQAETD